MQVDMIVDESPSVGDGKIIEENPTKRDNGEKIGIKRARIGYGDKVCYHYHKRGHIQYTCNKLKRDLRKLKLLKEMKKTTMEVGDADNLKGKKIEIPFEKDDVLPSIGNMGLVLNAKCDVVNGDSCDWVFDSIKSYYICRNKRLFTRVMACEYERVTLPRVRNL